MGGLINMDANQVKGSQSDSMEFKGHGGHRLLKVAAGLGVGFVISHIVTVIVTCVVEGFGWGATAWILDAMGFTAGVVFTAICWVARTKSYDSFRKGFTGIFVWSISSVISRGLDIMMLFGIVKWSSVYVTPEGPVLISNIISEILFGFTFNLLALIGTLIIYIRSRQSSTVK